MIQFKPVSISDREWVIKYLRAENSRSAGYNFGSIFMWDYAYRQSIAVAGERLLCRFKLNERRVFAFPVGSGDVRPAIEAMTEMTRHKNQRLVMCGLTEEQVGMLDVAYPGRFSYSEARDMFDYVYDIEKLATYSGKKLHGKRNHCNRFEAAHNWDYVRLTPQLIPRCMEMLGEWTSRFETPPDGLTLEHSAILRGFMNYDKLHLEGGVLRIDGEIVGFTVGERTSDDTFDVHFEKAFPDINGAYPMICREFARQIMAEHPDVKYLNREEDMGLENLRKAKLDFHPEFLISKYIALETQA